MINTVSKIKRLLNQLAGFIPTALPVGVTEFDAYVDALMSTYTLPTTNRDSIAFTVATAIMHLGPTAARMPKRYFVLMIRAGAAKQVGGAVFVRIKEKQKAEEAAAQAAAAAAKLAEAPALSVVASDERSV